MSGFGGVSACDCDWDWDWGRARRAVILMCRRTGDGNQATLTENQSGTAMAWLEAGPDSSRLRLAQPQTELNLTQL